MSLNVKCAKGTVYLNGTPIPQGHTAASYLWSDFVNLADNSCANIYDVPSSLLAAVVYTGSTTLCAAAGFMVGAQQLSSTYPYVYAPPAQSFVPFYYNTSPRWQLTCPGGSIGIRM